MIENFRQALPRIYRCGSTDPLANLTSDASTSSYTTDKNDNSAVHILTQETGLVLDLRSPKERNDIDAQHWTSHYGFLVLRDGDNASFQKLWRQKVEQKVVLRLEILSRPSLKAYVIQNFLSPTMKEEIQRMGPSDKARGIVAEALNQRGLVGLNEIILETGGGPLCRALQIMTTYLEGPSSLISNLKTKNVAIHCVQGKDRTGMLVMLCQSIMGWSDDEIVQDYHLSDNLELSDAPHESGKLDLAIFTRAPGEAMMETLTQLRAKHGSISNYLDVIGFDKEWRNRFEQAQRRSNL